MSELDTSFSSFGPQTALQRQDLRAQAEQMEGVFLNTLMSEMFKGINSQGEFGGGFGEETWRTMQSEQFANAIASGGGVGLADEIMRNLLSAQEGASTTPSNAYPSA